MCLPVAGHGLGCHSGGGEVISKLTRDYRLARLWPWIEKTLVRRLAFALVMATGAAALHWLVYPLTQGRITFIFFIPAIVLVTTIAGRWPGTVVAVLGLANTIWLKSPDRVMVMNSAEQLTLISSALVSLMVILVGDYYRSISRRELHDLHDLHELSAALSVIPRLPEQLQLILATFTRMHGATQGLISIYDPARDVLTLAASVGLSNRVIEEVRQRKGGQGVCGLVCVDKQRVVIEDTELDARVAEHRETLRREGVRAVHSTPLVGRDGELLGALTVHMDKPHRLVEREVRIADICARKAAVFLERASAEERVTQRDRRFQSVLEVSGVPFVVVSPIRDADGGIKDFRYVYVNTAAANVMRSTPSEVIGRPVLEVSPGAWDDSVRFQMYLEALERNEVREMERHTAADGNNAWFHIVASPLDGDLAIWFADITRRKQWERELVEADRRKDEFLATLAHELRNPLAPIRQAASIARNPRANDAQKRWSNDVIERQVQHMSLLLDDLLDVSRITHGTLQLRKQPTDLQSILDAAVETARPLIDERNHQLQLELPMSLQVYGDPLRLAQVLSNLLTNAAKYTNPGGQIRVRGAQQGDELVLSVEDNGIGIAAQELPKVFGMFAQVRSSQDHAAGGLGIGLALAKGIVELHGGRIEAASAGSGQGSRFTVHLPNKQAAQQDVLPAAARSDGAATVGKRILLADDNRDAAESLALLLRLEGHEVDLAHDGEAAMSLFTERRPDVALLDIGMPKQNGYEVARQIRATPKGHKVLLIAVTGWAQDSDKAQSRAAGFDHHLTKPVEPDTLIGLLGRP
jgi:PAS domain S-box-containing protein